MSTLTRRPEPVAVDLQAWSTRVRVVVTDPSAAPEAEARTRVWLDVVDRACSRFRDDSELTAVNRSEGSPVAVGPVLLAALTAAVDGAEATEGLVTPTVGRALCAAGYDRTFALVAGSTPSELPRVVRGTPSYELPQPAPDWRLIELDHGSATVRMPPGCWLDLGSTTKAWAADRLALELSEDLDCGVLVDLGGDVVARGTAPDAGWVVQVVDGPVGPGQGPCVLLTDGALATSSTVVRRWSRGGQRQHHIVDPRTGRPADEVWRTVTVSASTCLDANLASTACIVLGTFALDWLAEIGLPARLVAQDGSVRLANGWPQDGEAA